MHEIYELKEMLCEELEKYGAKDDLKAGELEIVDKLAHTIKNLGKIIEMYEEEDGEYSGTYYPHGGNYYRGSSYARGRGSRAKRDSMGRYSSERGYSRDAEDMIKSIRGMMQELPQEVQRDAQRFVQKLEQHMM